MEENSNFMEDTPCRFLVARRETKGDKRMSNVIDFWKWRRTRLGEQSGALLPPVNRRARTNRRGGNSGFVRIGEVSGEIVRLLKE
jgi:hypothetical protein